MHVILTCEWGCVRFMFLTTCPLVLVNLTVEMREMLNLDISLTNQRHSLTKTDLLSQ